VSRRTFRSWNRAGQGGLAPPTSGFRVRQLEDTGHTSGHTTRVECSLQAEAVRPRACGANSLLANRLNSGPASPGPPPKPADLKIDVGITGVLSKATLAPYSGELVADAGVRITDKNNTPSPGGPDPQPWRTSRSR
jgi:hypothetical protein